MGESTPDMAAPFEIYENITGISLVCGKNVDRDLGHFAQILAQGYQAKYPQAKFRNADWSEL